MGMLLTCHFIGDFILQNDYLAKNKHHSLYVMFIHVWLYSACILYGLNTIESTCIVEKIIFVFITHFIIDVLKSWKNLITFNVDQVLHIIVLVIIYVI